jgi:hypothetical protein
MTRSATTSSRGRSRSKTTVGPLSFSDPALAPTLLPSFALSDRPFPASSICFALIQFVYISIAVMRRSRGLPPGGGAQEQGLGGNSFSSMAAGGAQAGAGQLSGSLCLSLVSLDPDNRSRGRIQSFSRWTVTTSGAAATVERPKAADNQAAELHAPRAARGGGGLTSRWRREVGMVQAHMSARWFCRQNGRGQNHGVERCPYVLLG